MKHGDVKMLPFVYCEACNTWLDCEGNEPEVELYEHAGELHE